MIQLRYYITLHYIRSVYSGLSKVTSRSTMAMQLLNGKYSIEIDSLVNLMSLVEEGIFGRPFVK